MQISQAALILTLAVAGGTVYGQPGGLAAPPAGQTQGAGPGSTPDGGAGGAMPVNTPSSLLKPSLTTVQNTLNALKLDKWKKGSVRDEAGEHVESLLKDLQTNVPPLMTAADAAPQSLSQVLPLMKHLDAFYDVLLRVEEAARVSGPPDQLGALQQSMLQLNQARLAQDDLLQTQAAVQEKQVVDLQGALKSARADLQAKANAVPAPVPCKPATPVKKKPTTKKPTGTPTTTPGTAAKPAPVTPPGSATPAKPAPAKPSTPPQGQPKPQ